MPIHFYYHHRHMNNLPLFPNPNVGTYQPQTLAHPRHNYSQYNPAPNQTQKKSGYYFQAPLRCRDCICHQTITQHVHHAECKHSLYMNEQWRLASAGTPSLASQYKTRSIVLAAKERRFTSFTTLLGFLFNLGFGSGTVPEEKMTTAEQRRPIGEILWELCASILQFMSNLLGYSIFTIYKGIKRVDWGRVWKIVAFAYIAYIWGGKEEKRLERLGEIVKGRLRAVSDLSMEGPRYFLVEDRRGWSRSVWDMPGI